MEFGISNMNILIYGFENFLIYQKRKELEEKFRKKNPQGKVEVFDLKEKEEIERLKEALKAQGLFSQKKFLVLKNFLSLEKEFLDEILNKYFDSKETFLIFEAQTPSLEEKFLNQFSYKFYFPKLSWPKIYWWMKDFVKKFQKEIKMPAAKFLFDLYQDNLWALALELEKLSLFCQKEITIKDIEKFSFPVFLQKDLFLLSEKFFLSDKKSFAYLQEKLIQAGKSPEEIFYFLVKQTRNLLKVKYLEKNLNFHPFYLEKLKKLARLVEKEDLAQIYQKLISKEILIKEGTLSFKDALKELAF